MSRFPKAALSRNTSFGSYCQQKQSHVMAKLQIPLGGADTWRSRMGIQCWRVTEVKRGLKGEDSCFHCDSQHLHWAHSTYTELTAKWGAQAGRVYCGMRLKTKPFSCRSWNVTQVPQPGPKPAGEGQQICQGGLTHREMVWSLSALNSWREIK